MSDATQVAPGFGAARRRRVIVPFALSDLFERLANPSITEPHMATPKATTQRSPVFSDWKLGLAIGLATCALGWLAWMYAGPGKAAANARPQPVWLGVSKVNSQLDSGQVLAFKVGLQVKKPDDLKVLTPHVPAMETMIRELGQNLTRDDLAAEDGISDFGQEIRRSINNYLRKQKVEPRVVTVAFEEFFLNP